MHKLRGAKSSRVHVAEPDTIANGESDSGADATADGESYSTADATADGDSFCGAYASANASADLASVSGRPRMR